MELTQERLKELLNYDQETGVFTWLERNDKRFNSRFSGKKAGRINSEGYIHILIDKNEYKAHRLAFLYITGSFPKDQVDHINSIRSNNKWSNLRESTHSENQQNQKKAFKSNKSTGVLGVYFYEKTNRFRAHIGINKKDVTLGWFKTLDDASKAYIDAKRKFHPFGML
ncbi:MAG: HNH endonuclease [Taibaiella sp.]|jgi:hypothetical protein